MPTVASAGCFADVMPLNPPSDLERAHWALRAYDIMALATVSASGPYAAGVYFAPELTETGVQLLIATVGGSRVHREIGADPRVAFMCSPGNPSRWVQGAGDAVLIPDSREHAALFDRLLAHAAGARQFVVQPGAQPAVITVRSLTVVEEAGKPPLVIDLAR
jgi:Pyridoxamine 5'-phosphate oxidase